MPFQVFQTIFQPRVLGKGIPRGGTPFVHGGHILSSSVDFPLHQMMEGDMDLREEEIAGV